MTDTPGPIDNSADVIDSRDIIARVEWLEELDEASRTCDVCGEPIEAETDSPTHTDTGDIRCNSGDGIDSVATPSGEPLDEDERHELAALQELAGEADGTPDWTYGETLIRDTYFEDYARELAEDIGAVDPNAGWPAYCIDWERAARELRMDYTAVDFDGVTYWVRS